MPKTLKPLDWEDSSMPCDHRKALDLARNGQWEDSHNLVQSFSDPLSCLIHAYLHREEGDLGNADYWYRRAGSEMPDNTLAEELKRLYQLVNESE